MPRSTPYLQRTRKAIATMSLTGQCGCTRLDIQVNNGRFEDGRRYGTRREQNGMSQTQGDDRLKQQIRHLRELIAALDRRVPRIERAGEANIARDAAALKNKALKRLAELEGQLRG